MKKLFAYMEQLGFSETESKIYLILLKSGPLTVQELAKKSDINRTAAYTPLSSLIEKGVIVERRTDGRKRFVVIDPDRLDYLIERKLESVRSIKQKFPAFVNAINLSMGDEKDEEKVDVTYYKGIAGKQAIYAEALQSRELRCYANLNQIVAVMPTKTSYNVFEQAFARNKRLKIFEFIADDPHTVKRFDLEGTAKRTGRFNYKFIPQDVGLSAACILLYDNKVAIINVRPEVSGIVLHNKDYYDNSKKLFDLLWRLLP